MTYVFDLLAYHYRWFRNLILEPPTCLVRDGKVLKASLRRELIAEDDLMRELRRQNMADPGEVKEAHLEADGEISVMKKAGGDDTNRHATAPTVECDDCDNAKPDDPVDRLGTAPSLNGRLHPDHPNGSGKDGGLPAEEEKSQKPTDEEPELREFLAAAEKLQARLAWHQDQAAKFKDALARYGVRPKSARPARPRSAEAAPPPPYCPAAGGRRCPVPLP